MTYSDHLYGEQEITEPIILELIGSPTLERLKGVSQHAFLSRDLEFSRFEHSLGVYFLLHRYQAPIEEQAAGLIHDVSHAAFSHCIDYVIPEGSGEKQSYQDQIFSDFVRHSTIPGIFKKYDFDINYILNDTNFPLKEKKLPDLCADRLDYSLRLALSAKQLDQQEVNGLLNGLIAKNGIWFFKNISLARRYANLFSDLNRKFYSHPLAAAIYARVGAYLRYALGKKYISYDDLYTTENAVLKEIAAFHETDETARRLFDEMNNKTGFSLNPDSYDARICLKSRAVDPYFKYGTELKRLSEIDPAWKKTLAEELRPKEYFIKFDD
jgi:hypothetical protein